MHATRTLPFGEFMLGPKRSALAPDELIVAVSVDARPLPQTFLKVGPRNAMVIAVVLARRLRRRGAGRAPRRVRLGRAA